MSHSTVSHKTPNNRLVFFINYVTLFTTNVYVFRQLSHNNFHVLKCQNTSCLAANSLSTYHFLASLTEIILNIQLSSLALSLNLIYKPTRRIGLTLDSWCVVYCKYCIHSDDVWYTPVWTCWNGFLIGCVIAVGLWIACLCIIE